MDEGMQSRVTGTVTSEQHQEQHLLAVLEAARTYIAAVKASEKGGVGRAWGALVKAVNACDLTVPTPADERQVYGVDHVQLAIPPDGEEQARAFYGGVLGLAEAPKPSHLAGRGGVWFESGSARVHLGVEQEFSPARKAHPALLVRNLVALVHRCDDAGVKVVADMPLAGYERVYVSDPFGNRIELIQRLEGRQEDEPAAAEQP